MNDKAAGDEEYCEQLSSTEPSRFSEEILQKLETLHNSVQEVNKMFDEPCNNSSNCGIYYAEFVYVQWWSWLRIHHLSLTSHPLLLSLTLSGSICTPKWSHWSTDAIHQCYHCTGATADSRPSHTDVNVISIIVLMAPSITATCRCGDDGNSLNTSNTSWAHQNVAETPSKVSNAWVCMLGLKQGGNFRGSFYLTEIKQVHSIVDNLVYNLFLFRMIGTETDVALWHKK